MGDIGIFHFPLQSLDGIFDDLLMVESEFRQRIYGKELGFGCVCSGIDADVFSGDERHIRYRDDLSPRIPFDIGKGVQLLEIDILDICLFSQFPIGGHFAIFFFEDESSWYGPLAFERFDIPFDKQNFESVLDDGEDDVIYRDKDILFEHFQK